MAGETAPSLTSVSATKRFHIGLPPIPPTTDPALKAALDRLREAVDTLHGNTGDGSGKAITAYDVAGGLGGGGGGNTTIVNNPGGSYTPELTPPPSVTGLAATAGFANIIVTFDAPAYAQGHGNGRTLIYAVKKAAADATQPVFSDAVVFDQAALTNNIRALPSDLGIRWHIWAKYESKDGVQSTDPAGGVHGVIAQTGKVGTSDLAGAIILAGNLAPGSVTADKAAFDIGGSNLCPNNSFEVDSDGDGLADGWAGYNNSAPSEPYTVSRTPGRISGFAQRMTWTGANSTVKGFFLPGGAARGEWLPGKTYVISFYARASAATPGYGCDINWNLYPATRVDLKNPALATTWQRYAFRITWSAFVEGAGRMYLSIANAAGQTGWVELDDVQVEEGDYLTGYEGKLALQTIVAGDGAISNLAITNALVGNAAIDDLKVANVSAAKLSVGDGTVGGNLKSAVFTSGSAGWMLRPDGSAEFGFNHVRGQLIAGQIATGFITATLIDGRGIIIRAPDGTPLFGAGAANVANSIVGQGSLATSSSVDYGTQVVGTKPPSNADNTGSNIAAGFAGQGAFSTLSLLTAANASTYIQNAAIGAALVGQLTAANFTVTAISNVINGSASSGARIEVAANLIRVIDASNTVRVKLGNLA